MNEPDITRSSGLLGGTHAPAVSLRSVAWWWVRRPYTHIVATAFTCLFYGLGDHGRLWVIPATYTFVVVGLALTATQNALVHQDERSCPQCGGKGWVKR